MSIGRKILLQGILVLAASFSLLLLACDDSQQPADVSAMGGAGGEPVVVPDAETEPEPDPMMTGCLDLDGDGIVDMAPENQCCISGYGNTFTNEYNCGTNMAEVQAGGCCPEDFLLRYSLQPGGEDTSAFDCVAFVNKETCATRGGLWSDDSQLGPGGCAHSAGALKSSDSASASGPALLAAVLAAAAAAL